MNASVRAVTALANRASAAQPRAFRAVSRCREKRMHKLVALLGAVACISSTRYDGPAADLIHAVEVGDSDRVNTLLESGVPINPDSTEGISPLEVAAWRGQCELLEALIGKGALVNRPTSGRPTALHLA